MHLVTQQNAATDAAAEAVVGELLTTSGLLEAMEGESVGRVFENSARYRAKLAAAQLRIERSLMAQQ